MRPEYKNKEYYNDLTSHEAIKNVESEERAKKLISILKYIIKNCNFELVERIHLRDKATNREYK